ncbi:MAG: prepilin-type N-terminal cleavage/methylation domain-containing protein [Heliobacteriaceae bacterium]|nr:prepilin-type N-terminal cleavage/methylation domain-containing protein [Heliobacteriaceae bacterium]
MNKAFTMAEVLITLGIIGVIAAVTMPALISNYQNKAVLSQFWKAYSSVSNAYNLILNEDGPYTTWGYNNKTGADSDAISEKFSKHMNFIRTCGYAAKDCWSNTYKTLNGAVWNLNTWESQAVLNDGALVYFKSFSEYSGFTIDVNGDKRPNTLGKDVFQFFITDKGIYPQGARDCAFLVDSVYCNPDAVVEGCTGTNTNGSNCAAWIVSNNNMDYLKCPGQLSWSRNVCP